ncbi:hypothetical protein SK128_003623 [Halocaridina rubra]|uniref:Protein kinase domain-containing protein n=1 Tax=Halocaridina rubra TaxID=373956 RepID=A0AAN8XUY7_HALRR
MVLVGHYNFGVVLGRGRFGWVSRATHQVVGQNVAIKHQPWAVGDVTCGGNTVAMLEVVRTPEELYVCLEYLGDTTLAVLVSQHFKEKNIGLDEMATSCIFRQVAAGLHYLHGEGILHRDVKPENVMVIPSQHIDIPVAKLIDLGLAAAWDPLYPPNTSESRVGTVAFMAPELTSPSCCYGPEIDVFSLGATLYYTLTGELPFTEYKRYGKRGTTALFGLQIHHEEALDLLTTQAALLIRNMLRTDPKLRWGLSKILIYDWVLQEYCSEISFSPPPPLIDTCDVFEKGILSSIIGKDYFSVDNDVDQSSCLLEGLINVKSHIHQLNMSFSNSSIGSITRQRIQSSCSESSICSDQDIGVNMECVDRVSVLLKKDYDHILEHLDKEPWGPVGGIYNLLLHAELVRCTSRS